MSSIVASPFDGLRIDRELVCELFAVFARFEFALKELGFIRPGDIAEPAWRRFAEEMADSIRVYRGSELEKAIDFLCREPPQVQTGQLNWEERQLHGATKIEQSLDAVKRIRNNLFHGGKHTPHSLPGRDEQLIRSSLIVLYACLEQNEALRQAYSR